MCLSSNRYTVHADAGFHIITVCMCTLKLKVAKIKKKRVRRSVWGCNVVAWCRNVYK